MFITNTYRLFSNELFDREIIKSWAPTTPVMRQFPCCLGMTYLKLERRKNIYIYKKGRPNHKDLVAVGALY